MANSKYRREKLKRLREMNRPKPDKWYDETSDNGVDPGYDVDDADEGIGVFIWVLIMFSVLSGGVLGYTLISYLQLGAR